MAGDLAVALLGGRDLASSLADAVGVPVLATTAEDHLDAAAALSADATLVAGLSTTPWPTLPDLHAQASAQLPAYTGVVAWHALPSLLDRLAEAVAPGARAGAHVLLTAPDPGAEMDPSDVAFLREVAEGVGQRTTLSSRSIAWRGDTRAPTAVDALTSLAEAHGKRDVVECPVAPGTGSDPVLMARAEALGMRLTCVDLGRATLVELLAEVARTVAAHELDDRDAGGNGAPGAGSA